MEGGGVEISGDNTLTPFMSGESSVIIYSVGSPLLDTINAEFLCQLYQVPAKVLQEGHMTVHNSIDHLVL